MGNDKKIMMMESVENIKKARWKLGGNESDSCRLLRLNWKAKQKSVESAYG